MHDANDSSTHQPVPAGGTIVIGAGSIGLCIAEQLSERGVPVVVVDKGGIAAGASFGNAGLVSYGHPPLARPGVFGALIRSMTNPRAPLHMPPRASLAMVPWLWAFRRACRVSNLDPAMRTIVELSRIARGGFERYAHELGLDFDYRSGGYMDVFRGERELDHEQDIADLTTRLGIRETRLSSDEALARQPAIRPGIAGAILHEEAAFAHPGKFCQALGDRLRGMGVGIRTGVGVHDIVVEGGRARGVALADGSVLRAETVVLAAGPWSPPIAQKIGVRIPMQPAKGYHTTVAMQDGTDTPAVTEAINFADDWVAMTPMDGRLRLAGTLEFDGMNHTMREDRLSHLVDSVARNLRWESAGEPMGRWCGLRPCTSDGMPIIGWSASVERFFVATGHAMMGFWTAPATGTLGAEMMTGAPASMDPRAFRVERF